jgi:WD40 repeat protein
LIAAVNVPKESLVQDNSLVAVLHAFCSKQPLLLLFDQFEEILTLCKNTDERETLTMALGQASEQLRGCFRMVLAMRSDYLGRIATLPGIDRAMSRPWLLKAPAQAQFRIMIEKPAIQCGYRFEEAIDDGKPEHKVPLLIRLLQDPLLTTESTSAAEDALDLSISPLPLLEFALERLWLRAVERGSHEFTHQDYDKLGGLGGAVATHAEDVFQELAIRHDLRENPQRLMEQIMEGLVSARQTSRPRRRSDIETESGHVQQAQRMIDHLVAERLLILRASRIYQGESEVELAHEVLIATWERLKQWLEQDAETRAFVQEFQEDAEQWDLGTPGLPQPRRPENLPSIERAKYYLDGLERLQIPLTTTQQVFCEELKVQRLRDAQSKTQLRDALRMSAFRFVEGDTTRQAALLREFEDPTLSRSWMDEAAQTLRQSCWHSFSATTSGSIESITFARDGEILVTNVRDVWRGTVQLWQVGCIGYPQQLGFGFGPTTHQWIGYDAEQDLLLVLFPNAMLQSYEIEAGPNLLDLGMNDTYEYTLEGKTIHHQRVNIRLVNTTNGLAGDFDLNRDLVMSVGYAPQASRLLTYHRNGDMRIWDLLSGTLPRVLRRAGDGSSYLDASPLYGVSISRNGRWAVTLDTYPYGDAHLYYLDESDYTEDILHLGHDVRTAAFSPDSAWVFTSHNDGLVRQWSMENPSFVRSYERGNGHPFTILGFNPAGTLFVAGTANGKVLTWPFNGRKIVNWWPEKTHDIEVVFSRDGMWKARSSILEARRFERMGHPNEVLSLAFSPDGNKVLTTSADSTARLWSLEGLRPIAALEQPGGKSITEAAFSPDGQWIATTSRQGPPHVWRADIANDPQYLFPPEQVSGRVDRLALESSQSGDRIWTCWSSHNLVVRASTYVETGKEETTMFEYRPPSAAMETWLRVEPEVRWSLYQAKGCEACVFPIRIERDPFVLRGVTNRLHDVSITADGRWTLGVSKLGEVFIWDADESNQPDSLGNNGSVISAAFSPDGTQIATGSKEGTLTVWDTRDRRSPVLIVESSRPIDEIVWSPDGAWILAWVDKRSKMFLTYKSKDKGDSDIIDNGKERYGQRDGIGYMKSKGIEYFWADAVRFIRAGQAVLAIGRHNVFEIGGNHDIKVLRNHDLEDIKVMTISPDGQWLAFRTKYSENQNISILSTRPGAEPIVLRDTMGEVTTAAASPNGDKLVVGHTSGVVAIWQIDLDHDSLMKRLWRVTPYCLTVEERMEILGEDKESAQKNRSAAIARIGLERRQ